jgi:outer membrane protein assembly factor BamD
MQSLLRSVAVIVSLLIGGCGLLPDVKDETADWSAQKLYTEAKEALNDGSYEKAIKYFENLEARYPYGRYAQQAQLEVAFAYYRSQEPALAITACERFIKLHPNHPSVDYAYYLKGLANFNEDLGYIGYLANQDQSERDPKAARESFQAFKELVERFPQSKYAADSTARMKYLVNALASHEVHAANYYLRRGAYVAAVNRAQFAIQNYPQTPAVEEAMFIAVKAYDALGMTELRDDTDRIMRKNFPRSEYYTRGFDKKSPWWRLW